MTRETEGEPIAVGVRSSPIGSTSALNLAPRLYVSEHRRCIHGSNDVGRFSLFSRLASRDVDVDVATDAHHSVDGASVEDASPTGARGLAHDDARGVPLPCEVDDLLGHIRADPSDGLCPESPGQPQVVGCAAALRFR